MAIKASPGFSAGAGGALFAGSDGKGSRQQNLGGLHSGMRANTGGSPMARSLNHYGKTPPAYLASAPDSTSVDPTQHPGVRQVRGGSGGIRRNPRTGGLGPGPESTPGGADDYSMKSMDLE